MLNPGGKSGRPRTPTTIKALRNERQDRRYNGNEPLPPQAAPVKRPPGMTAAEIALWEEYAPSLVAAGVLTARDVPAFRRYCEVTAFAREAHDVLEHHGVAIAGRMDQTVKNPIWQIYREAVSLQMALGARFGLTPADRAVLSIGREPEYNAAERLLS